MTAVAYIANEFPSPLEPYVMDEVRELRQRGVRVICCSGKRVAPNALRESERVFWDDTHFLQPLSDDRLGQAFGRLASDREILWQLLKPVLRELPVAPGRRLRSLGHTVLGSALADELVSLGVDHIHAHHGYFASWMALVAARLLGIGFSFTLHGSDLLVRGDLLAAKLMACRFCVTVSDFNRRYILDTYPSIPPSKILVQRLGVDRVASTPRVLPISRQKRFCLLAVGRLHRVKNYSFLIQACAALRDEGVDFLCWVAGEGPERATLDRQIRELRLQDRILLLGQVPRDELAGYYFHADLVVMTSRSEGLPVVLMEAMAHGRLVLAPAITGIPELVENRLTGFLYQPGSLTSFVTTAQWILDHKSHLGEVEAAAAEFVAQFYDRRRNLQRFADQFLKRVGHPESSYANSLLQQVQLPV
ncbi:MAG TPA: glycosyltransferase [Terriglobales bacterium]|nr:glycosyltransferase [Terriglobales bacterium]